MSDHGPINLVRLVSESDRDALTLIARDVHLYDDGPTHALSGVAAARIADAILAAGFRRDSPE